jgi:hypothetical protein
VRVDGPVAAWGNLDPALVPAGVEVLFALVGEWGLGDDVARWRKVQSATDDDLRRLIQHVDSVDETALYGWLSGPESFLPSTSREYQAITCVTMAADQARVTLSRRSEN